MREHYIKYLYKYAMTAIVMFVIVCQFYSSIYMYQIRVNVHNIRLSSLTDIEKDILAKVDSRLSMLTNNK